MPVYISLLRAIHLAGHNRTNTSVLEGALRSSPGFEEVTTYLQSGTLLFRAARPRAKLRHPGREVYLTTKLSNQATLAVRATTRNWKTVHQRYRMAAGIAR